MREIIFRGKRISNGEWVNGGIIKTFHPNFEHKSEIAFLEQEPNCYAICANNRDIFVEQETIGQFIGITVNDKKVFEGDIIRIISTDYCGFNEIGKVEFKDGCFGISYIPEWEKEYGFKDLHFHRFGQVDKWQDHPASGEMRYTYEIIGNIHDNPELLE